MEQFPKAAFGVLGVLEKGVHNDFLQEGHNLEVAQLSCNQKAQGTRVFAGRGPSNMNPLHMDPLHADAQHMNPCCKHPWSMGLAALC